MRRVDLINASNNVRTAILESNLQSLLRDILVRHDEVSHIAIANAFRLYIKHSNDFAVHELDILKIFDLGDLNDSSFWAIIFKADMDETRPIANRIYSKISLIIDFLPKFNEMLKQHNVGYELINGIAEVTASEGKEIFTIILPEDDNFPSHPSRIINALQSIMHFYKTFAQLENIDDSDISVAAIDSGSDKSFDITGSGKVIKEIREFVIAIWDRLVFHKERKIHERIELVSKTLPVIERINKLKDSGALGAEQCEILKNQILDGTNLFIQSGAILPEFDKLATVNPRQIMAIEPKLLSEHIENISEQTDIKETETLTTDDTEQFEQFKKFLEQQKKSKTTNRNKKK